MKKYCFLLLTCLLIYSQSSIAASKIIEDKAKLQLLTPDLAKREKLKIRLDNGLEALLISDPNAEMSGAMLSVRAGSWQDPDEYPGLAHFLEHMLFMGTKKYPKEAEYSKFINEHGGTTNAFTTSTYTSYLFEIDNSAFSEGLDRFASFFSEPLFNPSGVSRELQAIDQEYAKNLEDDDWRVQAVAKELAHPQHPYHRFAIGNSKTLSKVSRETLVDWYKSHYSANLMRLVVYSTLPLEELKNLVESDFGSVPNYNIPDYTSSKKAFSESYDGKMIYVDSIKNKRLLTLAWELPPEISDMKDTQPWTVACHVLGHEGKHSLLAELKRLELAEKIQCGAYRLGSKNMEFYIEIELTDAGLKQLNDVILLTFQAIANFKAKGVPSYLSEEIQKMQKIDFQYQVRADAFSTLMKDARQISEEDFATYPEQTKIIQKFSLQDVVDLLNQLTPHKAHYFVISPTRVSGIPSEKREKWLGVGYTIKPIPSDQLTQWQNVSLNTEIDLPRINRLIPGHLNLIPAAREESVDQITPHPTTILDSEKGKVYFAQDSRFNTPTIFWYFEIKTPKIVMGNPSKVVLADLYIKSINEKLSDIIYNASIAGLRLSIERTDQGIGVTIEGYSENAQYLLEEVLKQLKTLQISENQFYVFKDSLRRQYQDFYKKSPLEQAAEQFKNLLYQKYSVARQKASAINGINLGKFNEFLKHLFSQTYVEGTLYGNMTQSQAEEITTKLLDALGSVTGPKDLQQRPAIIMLPSKTGPYYIEGITKTQGNAAILAIELPFFDFKMRAMQQILMQAMQTPFFATLRTKQQTGYIVYSDAKELERHLFNIFAVQSNTHATRDLLARFELFIEEFSQEMPHEFSENDFTAIKKSLISQLEYSAKNVEEMGYLLHKIGFEYQGDFDWVAKRIEGLQSLTFEEFNQMAKEILGRQNRRRVAILLNGTFPEDSLFEYDQVSVSALKKLSEYNQ